MSAPRRIGAALERASADLAPATLLAAVQAAWPRAAGPAVARQSTPISERAGVITVRCESAAWAEELDLLGPELLAKLNGELGRAGSVAGLRFTAAPGP